MRFLDTIGNIFLLDKDLRKKEWIITIFVTLFTAILKYILDNESIASNLKFSDFMYLIIGLCVVHILLNFKIIIKFFKEYFVLNTLFFGIIFEIALGISIIIIGEKELYSWILAILWIFSGFLRVLIEYSKALFELEMSKFLTIIQIFAYARAAYWAVVIIWILNMFKFSLGTLVPVYLLFLGISLWYISNLSPYMNKHENVRNAILLFRTIKDNKGIKANVLQQKSGFSQEYFNKLLLRYHNNKIITIKGSRIELTYSPYK